MSFSNEPNLFEDFLAIVKEEEWVLLKKGGVFCLEEEDEGRLGSVENLPSLFLVDFWFISIFLKFTKNLSNF